MRKQFYFALAALILGSAAVPEVGYAETWPAPTAAPTTVLSTAAEHSTHVLKKRKKRKKRRAAWQRRR